MMNQLSLVGHPLGEIHLSEVISRPSRELGHDELVLLVEKNQEAALIGVRPRNVERAAKLCFDKVDAHFGAVSALLGNDRVFDEVVRTLRQMKTNDDPEEEKKAVAVALAALSAGRPMEVNGKDWPPAVRKVLQERRDASHRYQVEKRKKFEARREAGRSVMIPLLRKPFFSADPEKLKEPFRFPIELEGTTVQELHFVQAFVDHPKSILKQLSAADFSSLDLAQLEKSSVQASRGRSQTVVHTAPENFGKLLARLSCRVPKDGLRDFRGRCCMGPFRKAHDMVVRLSKKPSDGPMVKVAVYMPYMVSGDIPHLKLLPEELHGLSFIDFDISVMPEMEEVDLLCLDVGDRGLAQALAGQFVPDAIETHVTSVIHALHWGGAHEMCVAASALSTQGFESLNYLGLQLGSAVALAIRFENCEVLDELSGSPLLKKLNAETLEVLVWARGEDGESGFPSAIRSGEEAVRSMGRLLVRSKSRVPEELAENVLFNFDIEVALASAQESVVMAYGEVITQCFGEHLYSYRLSPGASVVRQFLLKQETLVTRLLLMGMDLPSNSVGSLLRGTGFELELLLKNRKLMRARAVLELVIAIQKCKIKLDKSSASGLLQEIRRACGLRAKFLCCGRTYSDEYEAAVTADPELRKLFQEAERLLKS